ncbi:MAG: serine/threonine protein kinase [Pseudomonadota bacterium]
MSNIRIDSNDTPASDDKTPFSGLTPDAVCDAIEAQGYLVDGRILALNSYENRVYQVGLDDASPLIAKFYRPERWTQAQILEEHAFCFELAESDFPVVPPLVHSNGSSLASFNGLYIALFERKGGRAPELDNFDHLFSLGQHVAKIHGIGKQASFTHRPALTVQSYGKNSVDYLMAHFIPGSLKDAYATLCSDLLSLITDAFDDFPEGDFIRCHADCHLGNMLWRDDSPHFVDFDDARMAPPIQDIWMLLSGDKQQQQLQLAELLEGYELFQEFDDRQLSLIEPLRTLRMLHHCAWLARRWEDPSFPMHFPWFNTERFWGEHILQLKEQFSALQEPHLVRL